MLILVFGFISCIHLQVSVKRLRCQCLRMMTLMNAMIGLLKNSIVIHAQRRSKELERHHSQVYVGHCMRIYQSDSKHFFEKSLVFFEKFEIFSN